MDHTCKKNKNNVLVPKGTWIVGHTRNKGFFSDEVGLCKLLIPISWYGVENAIQRATYLSSLFVLPRYYWTHWTSLREVTASLTSPSVAKQVKVAKVSGKEVRTNFCTSLTKCVVYAYLVRFLLYFHNRLLFLHGLALLLLY